MQYKLYIYIFIWCKRNLNMWKMLEIHYEPCGQLWVFKIKVFHKILLIDLVSNCENSILWTIFNKWSVYMCVLCCKCICHNICFRKWLSRKGQKYALLFEQLYPVPVEVLGNKTPLTLYVVKGDLVKPGGGPL